MTIKIRNVTIVDGKKTPKYQGSILIKNEKIKEIGIDSDVSPGETEIDGTGLYATPGFIDVHTHVDFGLFSEDYLLPLLSQGCTTAIAGNCGLGLFPFNDKIKELYQKISNLMGKLEIEEFASVSEYIKWAQSLPKIINVGSLIPHGNLHVYAAGDSTEQLTQEEINSLQSILEECLREGFFGVSFGLVYPPGSYLDFDAPELYAIGESVAKYNGIIASHVRDELAQVMESIEEMLKVGLKTGCSTEISHIKIANSFKWGTSDDLLAMIERYADLGANVHFDAYPYAASCNMLATTLLPPSFLMDQDEKISTYIKEPEAREISVDYLKGKMSEMVDTLGGFIRLLFKVVPKDFAVKLVLKSMSKKLLILSAQNEPDLNGKTLYEIAKERDQDILEAAFEMIADNECQVIISPQVMDWEDIDRFITHPRCMIGSDLLIIPKLKTHPRTYGTFSAFLHRYVIERGVLSWEEAIRKMSALPAQKFNLKHRGTLEVGNYADIVLLNPQEVKDRAIFTDSELFSQGIEKVFVNGELVYEDGEIVGTSQGRYLLRGDN